MNVHEVMDPAVAAGLASTRSSRPPEANRRGVSAAAMGTTDRDWPGGHGLLIVGHGTADRLGAAETAAVAALAAARLRGVPVELGFLEVIEPSIGTALGRLAARGCHDVVAAPLLLLSAGHARRDVPESLAAAADTLRLRVTQAEPLGCHPSILAVSRHRRRAAVLHRPFVPAAATALVMVGRGASDPSVVSQFEDVTARSIADDSAAPGHVGHGFVAVARPRLHDALAAAAGVDGVRRVVVQPHLLFRGHVECEVRSAVERMRRDAPGVEWVMAGRLGATSGVAMALVDRAIEAVAAGTSGGGRRF